MMGRTENVRTLLIERQPPFYCLSILPAMSMIRSFV